jgi:hypothetical protein
MLMASQFAQVTREARQVLDEPRWRALTVADTESFKAFNQVLYDNYRANEQTVTGWWWHCQLSDHSCAACVAMHGTIHPLSEHLNDHPNGSCVAVPYVAGMKLPDGQAWFDLQSAEMQRKILGTKIAYRMYKSGMPLKQFIGKSYDTKHGTSVYQRSAKELMR